MGRIVIRNLSQVPEWDRSRLEWATRGANLILAHPRFKEELLKAKLTETQIDGRGPSLTNEEVYNCISKADQLAVGDKEGELDIEIVMYRKSWSKVVGYTYTNSLTIWINRKFFGSPKSIASNLVHEGSHQLGFLHNHLWATAVPYVLNRIVEKLWDELPELQKLETDYWKWWYS